MSSRMAFVRRNKRLVFFAGFGILVLAILYFTDLRFLRKASLIKLTSSDNVFEASIERFINRQTTNDAQVEQCEKVTITPPDVDIKTEELWLQLFGEQSRDAPRNVWTDDRHSENPVAEEEQKMKVFVVPHSHVDPGWLKTFGDYQNETDNMLYSMISYMPSHPNMTFTWMEISFFEVWWRKLNTDQKAITKRLIQEGRFQITSGSWVMTDEATPYFWASIDNMVEGHQFLKRELDMVPSVMWSNDPFGYGPSVTYLFHLAGIKRAVLQRVHMDYKRYFGQRRMLDFYYRQFFDPTGQFDTHVHLLPYQHYDVPNSCGPNYGVCCMFDFRRITNWGCGGGMAEAITNENIARKAHDLYDQYKQLSRIYKSNVLLVMLGDDFRYDGLREWSQQHDNYMLLMDYMDKKRDWNIEVRFGTFNDFWNAFTERTKSRDPTTRDRLAIPTMSGDFFPYMDVSDNYWTGYYTTRPFYKRLDRIVQAMIRSADISSSLVHFSGMDTRQASTWFDKMRQAHRDLALFQHHDAITGTSKWKVVTDYGIRLRNALLTAAEVTGAAIGTLIGGGSSMLQWTQDMPQYNELINDKVISLRSGEKTYLWMFNSQPYWKSELVHFRLSTAACLQVRNSTGALVKSQLNPIFTADGIEAERLELLFEAKLPPLAAVQYSVTHSVESSEGCAEYAKIFTGGPEPSRLQFPRAFDVKALPNSQTKRLVKLENNFVSTYHDASTGFLEAMKSKVGDSDLDLGLWKTKIEFRHYTDTSSGAYLFVPSSEAKPWPYAVKSVVVVSGSITDEIHSFSKGIHHKEYLRKFATAPEPEIQLLIENTLDIRSERNTEVVMRILTTDVTSNRSFLTDSLGLQLMPRQFLPHQRMDRNYYPMSSQFIMQTDDKRLTLVSGQPHGATSPVLGGVEVMLDRKLTNDDSKGLGYDSLIQDNVPVTSVFRLVFEHGDFEDSRILSLRSQRSLQNLLYPPVTLRQTTDPVSGRELTPFTPLQSEFPCDTLLVNIRPLDMEGSKRKHLLLLHRVLSDCRATNETACRGMSHTDLANQLKTILRNPTAQECTLTGVDVKSSRWTLGGGKSLNDFLDGRSALKPMEIKSICIT